MDLKYKKTNTIDEKSYKTILKNYKFYNEDATNLKSLKPLIYSYKEDLLKGFYEFIFEFEYAQKFLHNEEILKRHKIGIAQWYLNLFCGEYKEKYFDKLHTISEIHVRIGLPVHYVNAAFSFVRSFIKKILIKENRFEVLVSVDKIIDINLDILTISYKDEEQSKLVDEVVLLKKTIETDSIEPYIQPIYDAKDLKIKKYEALMRIIVDSQALSIFPYLATAKRVKLYENLMESMIDKSLENLKDKEVELNINLSYEDIASNTFKQKLYQKIQDYKYTHNITFEILESDFIEDFAIVEEFVNYVRKLGCKIAIDDFGSGYSNMENILKLKPEFIKIDGSLIKDIHINRDSKIIVKNIINMAEELQAKTVAEYVHSKEVFEITKDLGVDYLQGFYLGVPKKFKKYLD